MKFIKFFTLAVSVVAMNVVSATTLTETQVNRPNPLLDPDYEG